MATRTHTEYVDDIDGSTDDVDTVQFGYYGTDYEIDLSKPNRTEFENFIEEHVQCARKVNRSPKRTAGSTSDHDVPAIRKWAAEQGIELKSRGRIPADVVAKYDAGH